LALRRAAFWRAAFWRAALCSLALPGRLAALGEAAAIGRTRSSRTPAFWWLAAFLRAALCCPAAF
jgi:hypothetical protein